MILIYQVGLLVGLLAVIFSFFVWALLPKAWHSTSRWSVSEAAAYCFIIFILVCALFFTQSDGEPLFVSRETVQRIADLSAVAMASLTVGSGCAVMAAYAAVGLVWATVHFWLYAKRLGKTYVMERDRWLTANGVAAVGDLNETQRRKFQTVLALVKGRMHYEGDFPLKVLQQKRFFAGNVLFWPVTLFIYLLWDLMRDVALNVVYALRDQLTSWWSHVMRVYENDTQLTMDKYFSPEAAAKEAANAA
ncbi:hypothetical protein [Comamonas thiooxydans]|uniref:hypothetical protein n=1 Tax=Comamonas thiooxydans TaxID=363952 RepID=UPI000B416F56|nr:hypothetical protein [Comamonas thiooxydans]